MSEWTPSTPSDNERSPWRQDPGDTPPLPESSTPPASTVDTSVYPPPSWEALADAAPFEPVPVNPPHVEPEADPDPEHPSRIRRVGKIAGAAVAVVALTGVGFVAGAQFADDDDPLVSQPAPVVIEREVPVAVPAEPAAEAAAPEAAAIPDAPGPVDPAVQEPVAAVAASVAPAVVRLDTGTGTGSGVIYSEDGLIITNAHVVGNADTVSVQLADGTRVEGEVLGGDPAVDIAVVQIDSSIDFVVAPFAPTSSVETGQLALAIGSPFGLEQSVTGGYISAVNRAVPSTNVADGSPTVVEMLQTDAPINPGNSGGALADREGRVVGINTSIRTDGTVNGNLGVGFAIPSDTAILIANRIVSGESLDIGFLGINGTDPSVGAPGALVTDVVDGGPAEAGGLEAGDLIVSVNGVSLPGMTELAARIRLTSPGTVVDFDVIRDGETISLQVTLGTLGGG